MISWILIGLCVYGCQSARPDRPSQKEMDEAIKAAAQAVSGKELNEKELKDLKNQLKTDKEAQSAVQSISESLDPSRAKVKYSPLTGKRYAPHLEYEPGTGVKLEVLE